MVFLHLITEFCPEINKSHQLRGLGLLQQNSACRCHFWISKNCTSGLALTPDNTVKGNSSCSWAKDICENVASPKSWSFCAVQHLVVRMLLLPCVFHLTKHFHAFSTWTSQTQWHFLLYFRLQKLKLLYTLKDCLEGKVGLSKLAQETVLKSAFRKLWIFETKFWNVTPCNCVLDEIEPSNS